MKAFTENNSFMAFSYQRPNSSELPEVKALQSMLKTAETLFFSMPIPEEVVGKYNYLKESKFRLVGLNFTPITKAQFPLIGTSGTKSSGSALGMLDSTYIQLLENTISLSVGMLENWMNTAIQLNEGKIELKMNEITEIKLRINKGLKELSGAAQGSSTTAKKVQDIVSGFMKTSDSLNVKYLEILKAVRKQTDSLKSENKLLASNTKMKEKQILEEYYEEIQNLETVIKKQNVRIQELEKDLQTINGKLRPFYETHNDGHLAVNESAYAEFIVNYTAKLSNDNQWLIEKLAELGKENEELKKVPKMDERTKVEMENEIRNAKQVIESFNKNYGDLMVRCL